MNSKNDENRQFYLFHYQKTELRIKSIGDGTSGYYNWFPVETHKSLTLSFGFAPGLYIRPGLGTWSRGEKRFWKYLFDFCEKRFLKYYLTSKISKRDRWLKKSLFANWDFEVLAKKSLFPFCEKREILARLFCRALNASISVLTNSLVYLSLWELLISKNLAFWSPPISRIWSPHEWSIIQTVSRIQYPS